MSTTSRRVREITHDLNNILTSILGYAEMLAEDAKISRVEARDAEQLLAATREAVALAKELGAVARPDAAARPGAAARPAGRPKA